MNNLNLIIEKFNPIIIINGKNFDTINDYLKNSDYTNNCLHSYYHNKVNNTLNIDFISEYQQKKITGSCGC